MANPVGIPSGLIRQIEMMKREITEMKRIVSDIDQRLAAIEKARKGGRPPKQPQEATAQEEMPF